MSESITVTTKNSALKKNIDLLRGDVPRSKFIIRVLETYISQQKETGLNKKLLPVDNSVESTRQQA